MIHRLIAAMAFVLVLLASGAALAQPAELPEAGSGRAAFAPFEAMVGRSWRGSGTGPNAVEDIQRWDWAIGGHAIRVVHSVNGGAYAGETLIFRDRDSGAFIFHYFTTGGFHTTGTLTPSGPGAFDIDETVHGAEGIEQLKSTAILGADGVYRVRSRAERNGEWVEAGGFDYREDPTATPILPALDPGPSPSP